MRYAKRLLALLLAAALLSLAACSLEPEKKEYKSYATTVAQLAEMSPVDFFIPAKAPEGTVLTQLFVLTGDTAVAQYENGSFTITIAATKKGERPAEIFYNADLEKTVSTVEGREVTTMALFTEPYTLLYAETVIDGVKYFIDSVTQEQLGQILGSLVRASDVTDEIAARGLARTDCADEGEALALTGIVMHAPETVEGYEVAGRFTLGSLISAIAYKGADKTLNYYVSKGDAGDCVNAYASLEGAFAYTDDTFSDAVVYYLTEGGDTESFGDDTVYLAEWTNAQYTDCHYYLECPEGMSAAEFIEFSANFYNASVFEPYTMTDETVAPEA